MEALRAKENGDFKEAKRLDLEREQKPSAETMEQLRDEGLQEVVEKWMEGINEGEGLLADFLADVAYVERERDGREGTPTVEMPQTLFVEPSTTRTQRRRRRPSNGRWRSARRSLPFSVPWPGAWAKRSCSGTGREVSKST